jgi:hypothetical protein
MNPGYRALESPYAAPLTYGRSPMPSDSLSLSAAWQTVEGLYKAAPKRDIL